ncbi:hypothetical protein QBC43DRAFT_95296 [Cladorrhinum sp. PSN259]|nr:hypothetical protein QBC43DRAFT_95296 [Cladorrhinum sp. PSN259]
MFGSRQGEGSPHTNDAEPFFYVFDPNDFSLDRPVPPQQSTNLADAPPTDPRTPVSRQWSGFPLATKVAVDRNALYKPSSLGQRARRAANRLWPAARMSGADDAMSVPSDTMSLSTISDSFISDRSSLRFLHPTPSIRSTATRQPRPTIREGQPLEVDDIVEYLLHLDIQSHQIDIFAEKLTHPAPLDSHIEWRDRARELAKEREKALQIGPSDHLDWVQSADILETYSLQTEERKPRPNTPPAESTTRPSPKGSQINRQQGFELENVPPESPDPVRTGSSNDGYFSTTSIPVDEDCSDSDSESATSAYFSQQNIASIGAFATRQLFGAAFSDTIARSDVDEAVENFISDLLELRLSSTSPSDGVDPHDGSTAPNEGGGSSLKRKANGQDVGGRGYHGMGDGEDGLGGDENQREGGGNTPSGKSWTERDTGSRGRLEFMCPFRMTNPCRFNVREWYDCATKLYVCEAPPSKRNELNELRRHIRERHTRPGVPTEPYCSKCKEEFTNTILLDHHARGNSCIYREFALSDDPLDGLTPDAKRLLTTKKGRQGDSPLDQYRQICQIVLGKDAKLPGPGYIPVIEDYELHQLQMDSLPALSQVLVPKLPTSFSHEVYGLVDEVRHHMANVFHQCKMQIPLATSSGPKRRRTAHRKFQSPSSSTPARANEHIPPIPLPPNHTTTGMKKGRGLPPLIPKSPHRFSGIQSAPLPTAEFDMDAQWRVLEHQPQPPSLSSPGSSTNDLNQPPLPSPTAVLLNTYSSSPQQTKVAMSNSPPALQAFADHEFDQLLDGSWSAHLTDLCPPPNANNASTMITTGDWRLDQVPATFQQNTVPPWQRADQQNVEAFPPWI